jgi:hypothetical protein
VSVAEVLEAAKGRLQALTIPAGAAFASVWKGEIMALPVNQYPAARIIPEVQDEEDRTTGFRTDLVDLTIWADVLWEDSEDNLDLLVAMTEALRDDLRANPELGGVTSDVAIGASHYVLTSRGGDTFRTSITKVRYEVEVSD